MGNDRETNRQVDMMSHNAFSSAYIQKCIKKKKKYKRGKESGEENEFNGTSSDDSARQK